MKQTETISLIDFKTNKDIFVEISITFYHQQGVWYGDNSQEEIFDYDWEIKNVRDIDGEDCLLPDYMDKEMYREVEIIISNIEQNG